MSVQLFKPGGSAIFDEYSYKDRLKEGWSLEDPALSTAETSDESENWVHPGVLQNNPTDAQVVEFAKDAEIPYAAMKSAETLKKDLGYENKG